jgi:hypothetical protein
MAPSAAQKSSPKGQLFAPTQLAAFESFGSAPNTHFLNEKIAKYFTDY